MRATLKTGLLVGASTIALGLIGATTPAKAFDTVNWRWDADVDETVTKNVRININLDPKGMVMVEDLQVFVGNAKATSTVYNINNKQPEGNPPDSLTVKFHYGPGDDPGHLVDDGFQSPEVKSATVNDHDGFTNGKFHEGTVSATLDLSKLEKEPAIDAVKELPSVVSTATAVANNTSITTDTAVQLHEGQFAFGGVGEINLGNSNEDNRWYSGNSNLSLANILLGALGEGGLTKSKIDAKSTVYDITNASVDSSATAVANNLSVKVTATGPDRLLMGDITQFAVADVTATSKVSDVSLENYFNLGSPLGRPIVSSVATAVGNNKSITVTAPTVR
jgi:hypothetical protein